ncbi:hypothetical protein FIBSPDRAFT_909360 [Athelia psychrophila]|uniref:CxC2-like cysteine cluster KDZ transposase-associated domain-containing protein n=1 Tax=Athelia psychrophila TaxID=1759441 RepID=A0A166PFC3_9AGAM|nr:hypothetical protein FIBSPDRAFT_909360 [Fibularhizoctonia sp. CBS 109695]
MNPQPAKRPHIEDVEDEDTQPLQKGSDSPDNRWVPFHDDEDWELAEWLVQETTQKARDRYLGLKITTNRTKTSYKSNYLLNKKVDALPAGPGWTCETVKMQGDRTELDGTHMVEELELWRRDPVECSLLPEGATIAPVNLASDKTHLTNFGGDKSAWPVYLNIGNISKEFCCQPSSHATWLVGYLPISKFSAFDKPSQKLLLEPLIEAGKCGVDMICADRKICRVFPILACLIACCMENRCPKCVVPPNERGDYTTHRDRDPSSTKHILSRHQNGEDPHLFEDEGLRHVYYPFWADLPHTNIFQCFSPDILHQLHKGVFKDHLLNGLRHFKDGISSVSQWTGKELKEMQRVFLSVISGIVNDQVFAAAKGLLDFIYLAQYQSHTKRTLSQLEDTLERFHFNKVAFIDAGIHEQFNILKIHSLMHYLDAIRLHGSADGFNTEAPERLHIDYTKKAYAGSSRVDYITQMTAVGRHSAFLAWVEKTEIDPEADDIEKALTMTGEAGTIFQAFQTPFQTFLSTHHPCATLAAGRYDCFDLYNSIIILLPIASHISHLKRLNKIQAAPEIPSKSPRKKPKSAIADTVLVVEDAAALKASGGLNGLQVVQVRVIFTLPAQYGTSSHPLAYVEWYRPLSTLNTRTGFYRQQCSTIHCQRHASIITVDKIWRACHLTPRFGPAPVDRLWVRSNVMELASDFLLNPYINHYIYYDIHNPT